MPGTTRANRQILALGNSSTYGGAGGTYATASGGNALSALISPHELGHSLGGLDDEYDYYARNVPGGAYEGGEPDSIHHTLLTEQQMRDQHAKWWRWLGEPSEAGGTIGRFEGGLYTQTGVWRPSKHSMMKTLGYAFDQVGRERMTQRVSAKVPLISGGTPAGTIGADRVVWVRPMHPVDHRLAVAWALDGRPLRGSDALDLRQAHVQTGEAHADGDGDRPDAVRPRPGRPADGDPRVDRGHIGGHAARRWSGGRRVHPDDGPGRRPRRRVRRDGGADRLDPAGSLGARRPPGRQRVGLRLEGVIRGSTRSRRRPAESR